MKWLEDIEWILATGSQALSPREGRLMAAHIKELREMLSEQATHAPCICSVCRASQRLLARQEPPKIW